MKDSLGHLHFHGRKGASEKGDLWSSLSQEKGLRTGQHHKLAQFSLSLSLILTCTYTHTNIHVHTPSQNLEDRPTKPFF